MGESFAEVVEEVKQLSLGEMEQLQELLKNCLIEKRRGEIRRNGEAGLDESSEGKLKSFSDVDDLMNSLAN
jgi:hypothetical protein